MNEVMYVHLIAAIVCAKWAGDLGFGQARQLLWAIAGMVAAPVVLLTLYARLVRQQQLENELQLATVPVN
jgi:positive regulator of sigma E activity